MLAVDRRGPVGHAARVGFDDKAWRAIEVLARELNARSPEVVARDVSRRAVATVKALGVRALDRLVSRVAGRRVDTAPLALPAADGAWVRRAVTGVASDDAAVRPSARVADANVSDDIAPPARDDIATPARDDIAPPARDDATPASDDATPARDDIAPPARDDIATPARDDATTPARDDDATPENSTMLVTAARPSDTPAGLHAPAQNAPLPALPPCYGIDRVVLLAGESDWVFAYWETDPARLDTSARAELRLIAEDGALVGRAYVDPVQGRQHLRVPARGRRYRAELVRLDGSVLSSSRDVLVRSRETV